MNEQNFKRFVESSLADFMETHKLDEIQVKDDEGNKGKIKRNNAGLLVADVTSSTVL